MSLSTIIASAVATANRATDALQGSVVHEAWIGQSVSGAATYAAPVNLRAIVDQKVQPRTLKTGIQVLTKAEVTFLEPVLPNGAAGRTEPLDARDKITLPDGTSGPIIMVDGFVNPDTLRPFFSQVWIG